MKKPAVIDGIIVALVLSILAAGFLPVAVWVLSTRLAVAAVSAVIALAYIAYLLRLKKNRAGTFFLWTLAAVWAVVGTYVFSLPAYLLSLAGAIWLVRWISVGGGILRGMFDAALTAASMGFAAYAVAISGSVAAGLWCFLLLQSLWTLIPNSVSTCSIKIGKGARPCSFDRAHSAAEEALRDLVLRAG